MGGNSEHFIDNKAFSSSVRVSGWSSKHILVLSIESNKKIFSHCCINDTGKFRISRNKYTTVVTFTSIVHIHNGQKWGYQFNVWLYQAPNLNFLSHQ